MRRRWRLPALLLAVGLVLMACGVGWALAAGVALPDQDPTAEMVAYAAFHHEIVDALLLTGAVAGVAGLIGLGAVLARTLIHRRTRDAR